MRAHPTDPTLDDTDHRLLTLLRQDAGRALHELGDLVGLSPRAVPEVQQCYDVAGDWDDVVLATTGRAHRGQLEARPFMDDPNVKRFVTRLGGMRVGPLWSCWLSAGFRASRGV